MPLRAVVAKADPRPRQRVPAPYTHRSLHNGGRRCHTAGGANSTDADEYEQGYLIGTQLGALKESGDWQSGYYFEELESNSTAARKSASIPCSWT